MTFTTASDTKLAAKSVRENWPTSPEQREAAIEHLRAVAADPKTRPQLLGIAQKALAAAGVEIPATQPLSETST